MALSFGNHLVDVSDDGDGLQELLQTPAPQADGDGFEADPTPEWDEPSLGRRLVKDAFKPRHGEKKTAPAPVKVTAALRKDVQAKTALLLGMGATAWSARDAYCGGAAMEAVPDVSAALADIFCDSPDIVRWFSSGSGYLKWLNLAAALQPVAGAVWGHHIAHTQGGEADAPGWDAYAAG